MTFSAIRMYHNEILKPVKSSGKKTNITKKTMFKTILPNFFINFNFNRYRNLSEKNMLVYSFLISVSLKRTVNRLKYAVFRQNEKSRG